jgi:hypothetical protein
MAHKKPNEKHTESHRTIALRRYKEIMEHLEVCRKKNGGAADYPFGVYIKFKDDDGKEKRVPFIDGDRQMSKIHGFTSDGSEVLNDNNEALQGYRGLEEALMRAKTNDWEVEVYFTRRKVHPREVFPMTLDMVNSKEVHPIQLYELEGVIISAGDKNQNWGLDIAFIEDVQSGDFGDKGDIERIKGRVDTVGRIKYSPKKERFFGIKLRYEDKDGFIRESLFIDGDKQMKDVQGYIVKEGSISFEPQPGLKGYKAMEDVLLNAKERKQKIMISVIPDERELEGIIIGDHDGFIFGEAGMISGDGKVFIEDAKDFGVNKKGEVKTHDVTSLQGTVIDVGYFLEEDVYKKSF